MEGRGNGRLSQPGLVGGDQSPVGETKVKERENENPLTEKLTEVGRSWVRST